MMTEEMELTWAAKRRPRWIDLEESKKSRVARALLINEGLGLTIWSHPFGGEPRVNPHEPRYEAWLAKARAQLEKVKARQIELGLPEDYGRGTL